MVAGTLFLTTLVLLGLQAHNRPPPLKTQELALATALRRELAAQSEAEKSAVMVTTDEAKSYADQARARAAEVERDRADLDKLLQRDGTAREKQLLADFGKTLSELQRVDAELLDLAVKNTNLKAAALTYGPAAEAARQVEAALVKLMNGKTLASAARAQAALLHIQVLLPPHIAEESDAKMDAMEAEMKQHDAEVRNSLEELRSPEADVAYARFSELRKQILALSRENTNVRSLAISLKQKRKLMLMCQDTLAALEEMLAGEAAPGALPKPR
jgi:hypothetical protein